MLPDPEALVPLTTARTDFEAEMIAEALRNQGLRAEVFAAAASVMQTAAIPIQVLVCQKDLPAAKNALRAIKAESVDIDWSEVDTGDRAPVPCPECKQPTAKGPPGTPCPICARPLPRIESPSGASSTLTRGEWRAVIVVASLFAAAVIAMVIFRAVR